MTTTYRDTLNADGSFNRAAILIIANNSARKDRSGDSYRRVVAREMRAVWQIARSLRAAHTYQKAA